MVRINNCLFSLLAVGICAYTYHVPLSLWFNSGVEHGSLSYICKILFNTWYIFHTSVIDTGPKHTHTQGCMHGCCTKVWFQSFLGSVFTTVVSVPSVYFLISFHFKSVVVFNVRVFPLWGGGFTEPSRAQTCFREELREGELCCHNWFGTGFSTTAQ